MTARFVAPILGLVMTVFPLALAAAPATRPRTTTRPVAKVLPLSDRDSNLVTNAADNFKIRIPKEWKDTQRGTVDYELPSAKDDGTRAGAFYISTGQMCHPGATLDEQVKANVELWSKDYEGFKQLKNEPTELNGVPATMITYERTYETSIYNPRTKQEKTIPKKERCISIICLNGDRAYFIGFDIDSAYFSLKMKLVNRVVASFEWAQPQAQK
jgi:hypothetical protein